MNYYLLNIDQQLINLTLFLLRFLSNGFLQYLKIALYELCNYALYKQRRPYKAGGNVYMGEKRPTKARSRFYERGKPVSRVSLFSYKQILIFQ